MLRLPQTLTFMALALLLIACSASADTPEETIKAFYKTIAANDVEGAIDYISLVDVKESEMTQARGKLQMMVGNFHSKAEKRGGLASVEVLAVSRNEDGTEADVDVRLTYGNGDTQENQDNLIKEDGDWKLSI
ncbi:DUF4878 domain-containing protein [Halomonas sabkhae]|uniref:DUF4878 domain-containing protein n=1 Tax=Halomonas sabkhae TaxID=626223 RepID=UPI0025B4CD02|nr:DUF4878 domain-containing protein [Halomonas sabkhae]MDN3525278.1 DUF4878 domain-containing protein [Halomonas sabkhae]